MDSIPFATKVDFTRDVIAVGHAINAGVVAKTAQTCEPAWNHNANTLKVDPLLIRTDPLLHDVVLTALAARVRHGFFGRGNQINVQGITDSLSAISKTIQLAGYPSPIYRAPNRYNLSIERAVEGWR